MKSDLFPPNPPECILAALGFATIEIPETVVRRRKCGELPKLKRISR